MEAHKYSAFLPVFGYTFYAYFDRESFKHFEGEDAFVRVGSHGHVWLHSNYRGVISIQSDSGYSTAKIAGLIAHESTHVWQHICELIGEGKSSEEMEAYHIQYITETVMEWHADYMENQQQESEEEKCQAR